VTVSITKDGPVTLVTLDRPQTRNAVDRDTADRLEAAFEEFDTDNSQSVAVLYGEGGIELAIWCDLRVAARDASFGVFCRRWGVPLIDGGTVRLPRLVGTGRAMDLILTGREVGAVEAERIGLVNRVVEPGTALDESLSVAFMLAGLPQECLRNDRLSVLEAEGRDSTDAMRTEFRFGHDSLATGTAAAGAARFAGGAGRGGAPD